MDVDEVDPAAQAFQALSEAVQTLGDVIRDQGIATNYGPTLIDIVDRLRRIEAPLSSDRPLADPVGLPRAYGNTIGDLVKAVAGIEHHRRSLEKLTAQNRSFWNLRKWIAVGSGSAGMLLLIIAIVLGLRGTAAGGPELLAALLLKGTVTEAGARMLAQADPAAWKRMTQGYQLISANQETYESCIGAAERAKDETTCKLKVKPPEAVAKQQ